MSAIPPVNHVSAAGIRISNVANTFDLIKIDPDKIGFLGATPVTAITAVTNLPAANAGVAYVEADINDQLNLIIDRVNVLTAALRALGFILP